MNAAARQLRPLLQVALPVAVAVALVCLAVLNMALVKTWPGEPEDGVLWQSSGPGTPVVAAAVAVGSVAHRAGIHEKDQLLTLNGNEVQSPKDVEKALHSSTVGQKITYVVTRNTAEVPITIELEPMPSRVTVFASTTGAIPRPSCHSYDKFLKKNPLAVTSTGALSPRGKSAGNSSAYTKIGQMSPPFGWTTSR